MPGARLRRFAASPTAIVGATAVAMNLIRVLSSVIITRLLDAESYGIIGIITVISVVLGLMTDFGFLEFVIRSAKGDDSRMLDELWTLRLIRSVIMMGVMIACAEPVARYVGDPRVTLVIIVSSASFLVEGLSSMSFATAVRAGQVRRVSLYDLATVLAQTGVTIVLAYVFRSYWAVAYAISVGGVLKIALSYLFFPDSLRRFRYSGARAAELWQFSRFIVSSSIVSMLLHQSDKVILSRLFPLELFGLYILAATLAQAPSAFAAPYVQRVLFPLYAQVARDAPDGLKQAYYRTGWWTTLLFAFAMGGFFMTAPLVVVILYDPRYVDAGVYLQILAISTVLVMRTTAANALLIAAGRMWNTFAVNIARFGWLAVGGFWAYRWFGPVGMIWVVGTIEVVAHGYNLFALARARLLDPMRELIVVAAAAAGALAGYPVLAIGRMIFH